EWIARTFPSESRISAFPFATFRHWFKISANTGRDTLPSAFPLILALLSKVLIAVFPIWYASPRSVFNIRPADFCVSRKILAQRSSAFDSGAPTRRPVAYTRIFLLGTVIHCALFSVSARY